MTVPADWTRTTLGQVARWGSGGTPKAGTPSFYDGDIPWAVIGDLNDAPLKKTQRTITQAGLENSSAKWVPADAVLIAMRFSHQGGVGDGGAGV